MPEHYSTVPDGAFTHGQQMSERERRAVVNRLKRVLDWKRTPFTIPESCDAGGDMDDREKKLVQLLTDSARGCKIGWGLIMDAIDTVPHPWTTAHIRKVELLCMAQEVCQRSLDITVRELAATGLVVIGDPHTIESGRTLVDGVIG